jgi:hypothetical protein
MHLPRRALAIAGASISLLGVGTVAGAAIATSPVSNGVIYGCYAVKATNGSHTLVLQDSSTSCPHGYTSIKWNEKGPVGATGAVGPQGPAGPQGSAGSTGAQGPPGPGYEIYPTYAPGGAQDVAPGQMVSVTANCPAVSGKTGYATGGGVVTYDGPSSGDPQLHAPDLRMIDSYPYPGSSAPNYNTGWTATMTNESSTQTESFQTWAMCMYPQTS